MVIPTHIIAVYGMVEDTQGQILLVRTRNGEWVPPGGKVEAGENLIEALRREIQEESGIDTVVDYLIGVYSNTAVYQAHDGMTKLPTKTLLTFGCRPLGGALRTSDETPASRWVAKDKVLDWISEPAVRMQYQAYLDYRGKVDYCAYVSRPGFEIQLHRPLSK